MDLRISPGLLHGEITPPPSKSQAHRCIIAAALAKGESTLSGIALSRDISATISCMRTLGAQISPDGTRIVGIGGCRKSGDLLPKFDCGESGSTLRFLIPVALAVAKGGVFIGHGRLMKRPQTPYERICREKDIRFDQRDDSLRLEGTLSPGEYRLAGDISSQFITGLLFALPLLDGDSDIMLTSRLESADYVHLTLTTLENFGIRVETRSEGWHVPGGQIYRAQTLAIEPDWSQAAIWLAASALGSVIQVTGMHSASVQGDRVISEYIQLLSEPTDVTLDVRNCPDLLPPLAVIAALRAGKRTDLAGAGRLRLKESDRLDTVTRQLSLLGANVIQDSDSLSVFGVSALHGGRVSACNDHRIAMMLAVAATRADEPVIIEGADCVAKSYPGFWTDFAALGGRAERLD